MGQCASAISVFENCDLFYVKKHNAFGDKMNTQVKKIGRKVNMLEGPIIPSFIAYALPLMLAHMLQQLYHTVDVAVLGNMASNLAVASVGATTSLINMVVNTFTAIGTGSTIIAARTYGARDDRQISRLIQTVYTFSIALGLFVLVLGQIFARPLLVMTDCPENVLEGAELYMRIYFLGIPASSFYNFMAGIMRSGGDSRRPFIYLAVSGAVNMVLNIVLILITGNAVASVAIATVASMYVSAAMIFIHYVRAQGPEHLSPSKISIDFVTVRKIVRLGIPAAISSVCYSIPNLQIQSAINAYGDVGISGNTAATTVEGIVFHSLNGSVSATAAAFFGQCLGAKDRDRLGKARARSYSFWPAVALVFATVAIIFGKFIIGLVIPEDPAAIDFGYYRTCYLFACLPFAVVIGVNNGLMQAAGKTTLQMAINLVGTCGLRMIWMLFVYDPSPNKTPDLLYVAYPISYFAIFLCGSIAATVIYRRIKAGDDFDI